MVEKGLAPPIPWAMPSHAVLRPFRVISMAWRSQTGYRNNSIARMSEFAVHRTACAHSPLDESAQLIIDLVERISTFATHRSVPLLLSQAAEGS